MVDSCSRENGALCTIARSWLLFLHDKSERKNCDSNIAWGVNGSHQTFWSFRSFFASCDIVFDWYAMLRGVLLNNDFSTKDGWVLPLVVWCYSWIGSFGVRSLNGCKCVGRWILCHHWLLREIVWLFQGLLWERWTNGNVSDAWRKWSCAVVR